VLGHQIFDLLGLLLQPALMFAWLYVLTLPNVSAVTYYSTLALVGWYTSGLGYLVSTVPLVVHVLHPVPEAQCEERFVFSWSRSSWFGVVYVFAVVWSMLWIAQRVCVSPCLTATRSAECVSDDVLQHAGTRGMVHFRPGLSGKDKNWLFVCFMHVCFEYVQVLMVR
jgi:hypothetical protein